jgi:hypothetical protein
MGRRVLGQSISRELNRLPSEIMRRSNWLNRSKKITSCQSDALDRIVIAIYKLRITHRTVLSAPTSTVEFLCNLFAGNLMARQNGSRTGRCQGCNHLERVRIERLLSAGASIKTTARKFEIDYHALRRHWINHVSAEVRATYIAGAGVAKDQLEEMAADESLALIDHYRIVRGALYKGISAASEVGDNNALALLAARLHENFRDSGRLTGELQRGPLLNIQNNVQVNPDYTQAIARIVSAVAPYPEARGAVIAALRDLDAASTPALMIEDHQSNAAIIDG